MSIMIVMKLERESSMLTDAIVYPLVRSDVADLFQLA